MQKVAVFFFGALFSITTTFSQPPDKLASSEIYDAVRKLNFLGSALYIAAHPDDENTRLISYLSNEVKARTAYLSITRGDGGQNLIGPELRELLGVLRTQELLAARHIDGGEQLFTRANDFGYSKHPDETLKIWDKEEVLGDVVWAIRKFRPDVIINRFDHRTSGTTHGHHTSSAMLSTQAFKLAGDKKAYPDQLKYTEVWQPRRAFFNTSWWFYGSRENFEKADKSRMLHVDVGVYYPSKGMSNNEIAAIASSQHLCQGFGRMTVRGAQDEYVELIDGDMPQDKTDIFSGINTSWSRVEGGEPIGKILNAVESHFNFKNPAVHLDELLQAYRLVSNLKDEYWRSVKLKELKSVIAAVSGLYLEASADSPYTTPGTPFTVRLEAINRSEHPVYLAGITMNSQKDLSVNSLLENNQRNQYEMEFSFDPNTYSTPYWLMEQGSQGMYQVNSRKLIGLPNTPRPVSAVFNIKINNVTIPFTRDVIYRFSRPDKGELYEPFNILPPVTSHLENKVTIFNNTASKKIPVTIQSGKTGLSGVVSLQSPEGWSVVPSEISFRIPQKGGRETVVFEVTPPVYESEGFIQPLITVQGRKYDKELVEITYDHIPKQTVLLPSKAKVVHAHIEKAGNNIGYITGAGDEIPESLKQIGYHVIVLKPEDITPEILSRLDAIVVGIRAYNVSDQFKFKQPLLLDFVKKGGNMIVQYNTGGRRGIDVMAPYHLKVSRDRVTDENATVTLLAKNHSLINYPNKIREKDFDGWTQERGLYFPDEWATEYTPILSMQDTGETPKKGSLLVAPYGKGYYIYTGLSFFRELPAGVPGAFKLFSNMLSIGKDQVNKEAKIKG